MKKIVIVDDEKDFCFFVKKNLEALGGFEVSVCTDETAAVDAIREVRPALVLLDIVMPKISGPDIAERLKEYDDTRDIPVVFLTALVRGEETEKNNNFIGGEHFISKPAKIKEIVDVINMLT